MTAAAWIDKRCVSVVKEQGGKPQILMDILVGGQEVTFTCMLGFSCFLLAYILELTWILFKGSVSVFVAHTGLIHNILI